MDRHACVRGTPDTADEIRLRRRDSARIRLRRLRVPHDIPGAPRRAGAGDNAADKDSARRSLAPGFAATGSYLREYVPPYAARNRGPRSFYAGSVREAGRGEHED